MRLSRSKTSVLRTLAVRSKRTRQPRQPAAPPLLPRGPYNSSDDRGAWRWVRFRKAVGLEDTREVARLLDVTVKTIRRYEYGGEAPRWYQAALVGLVAVHGQHLGADQGLEGVRWPGRRA